MEVKGPVAPSTERSMPKLVPVASHVSLTAPAAALARRLKLGVGGPRGRPSLRTSVRMDSAVWPATSVNVARTEYGPGASEVAFHSAAHTTWSSPGANAGPPVDVG